MVRLAVSAIIRGRDTVKIRALIVAVALTTTLTACGGSDDKGSGLPSDSPSPTKSTTGTLLDSMPTSPPERPKDVRSKTGAIAFSSYVADMMFYVLGTNDVDALYGIADRKLCRKCASMQKTVEKRGEKVQVGNTPLKVSDAKVIFTEGEFYTVRQRVQFPTGATISSKTGKEVEKLDDKFENMNINIRWVKDAWVLLDYGYVKDAA
jgi:hypothetical protein